MTAANLQPAVAAASDLLNVRKPIGWTSNDVVRRAKRLLRGEKVGHAGTLDPFAEGVLLLCIGRSATKRIEELQAMEKEYRLLMELGAETDTLDISGRVIERRPSRPLQRSRVTAALADFIGEIEQTPPLFSAVHVEGRRAYELARRGETVDLPPRRVTVKRLELIDLAENRMTLEIVCSKGFYVRALVRDLARKLGELAYLKKLTRTRIGPYKIEDALSISEMETLLSKRPTTF